MNAFDFDSFARHATAHVSRRRSFAVLGALGMTVLVEPALTDAKKNRPKKKDKQRCNTQLADCNCPGRAVCHPGRAMHEFLRQPLPEWRPLV